MTWKETSSWARTHLLLVIIGAVLILAALGSAYVGAKDWFAKRAEIQSLKDNEKEIKEKAEEEKRVSDQAIAEKDVAFSQISSERDALRRKIVGLQTAQSQPWKVPATDNDLLSRFKALGY
jgi:hypothetical protein